MRLLITVTNDLVFAPTDDKIWERCDEGNRCRELLLNTDKLDTDAALRWGLSIDMEHQCIECVLEEDNGVYFETVSNHELPLRPGTIVLDDPNAWPFGPCGEFESIYYLPRVKAFRTPAFQNFMDKYGIYAMHRCNPRNKIIYDMHQTDIDAYTSNIYSDGEVFYDQDEGMYYGFTNASWILERRVRFDEVGNVACTGYVLYTFVRSIKRLEASFAQHGILPER